MTCCCGEGLREKIFTRILSRKIFMRKFTREFTRGTVNIHAEIHTQIHTVNPGPSVRPSDRPTGRPSDRPFDRPTVRPSVRLTDCPTDRPSSQLKAHSTIRSDQCSFNNPWLKQPISQILYGRSCNGPVEGAEVIYVFTGDSQGFRDFQLGACLGHALRVHSSVIAARFGVKNIHADFVGAVVCDIWALLSPCGPIHVISPQIIFVSQNKNL